MPLELLDIDDGYTLTGTAKANGWPSIVFKYRPALPKAVRGYILARERASDGDEEMAAIANFLKAHVASWDVTSKQKPAPVTAETLGRIPDPLLRSMIDVVSLYAKREVSIDEKNSESGSASS